MTSHLAIRGPRLTGVLLAIVVALHWVAPARGGDAPLKIHIISACGEYDSERSLKEFKAFLEKTYRIECTASWAKDGAKSLDNLDALKSADLLILFVRRMNLSPEAMATVRGHWEQGKPVLGIRTAGHAFQKEENDYFDRKVLGGHYLGHYANEPVKVTPAAGAETHPTLKGVGPFTSKRLYRAGELASDTVVLQIGEIDKGKHPVTLAHTYKGGRMFFTSLGVSDDFQDTNFRRMLTNAVFWTTGRDEGKLAR